MVVVLEPSLVPAHLTIKLVHQLINGGVHVLGSMFDEDVLALDVERDFGLLAALLLGHLFYRQQHVDVDHLVEVTGDTV